MGIGIRVLALSAGGMLGVNARYWLAIGLDALWGKAFPWATFTINVSGAFVLGFLAVVMARLDAHHPGRLLVLVGFLGGYTTFSTFALEAANLWEKAQIGRSLLYLTGSVAGGFLAVFLGTVLGGKILAKPPTTIPPPGVATGLSKTPPNELAEIA